LARAPASWLTRLLILGPAGPPKGDRIDEGGRPVVADAGIYPGLIAADNGEGLNVDVANAVEAEAEANENDAKDSGAPLVNAAE